MSLKLRAILLASAMAGSSLALASAPATAGDCDSEIQLFQRHAVVQNPVDGQDVSNPHNLLRDSAFYGCITSDVSGQNIDTHWIIPGTSQVSVRIWAVGGSADTIGGHINATAFGGPNTGFTLTRPCIVEAPGEECQYYYHDSDLAFALDPVLTSTASGCLTLSVSGRNNEYCDISN